jgi:hypothetical protein
MLKDDDGQDEEEVTLTQALLYHKMRKCGTDETYQSRLNRGQFAASIANGTAMTHCLGSRSNLRIASIG